MLHNRQCFGGSGGEISMTRKDGTECAETEMGTKSKSHISMVWIQANFLLHLTFEALQNRILYFVRVWVCMDVYSVDELPFIVIFLPHHFISFSLPRYYFLVLPFSSSASVWIECVVFVIWWNLLSLMQVNVKIELYYFIDSISRIECSWLYAFVCVSVNVWLVGFQSSIFRFHFHFYYNSFTMPCHTTPHHKQTRIF